MGEVQLYGRRANSMGGVLNLLVECYLYEWSTNSMGEVLTQWVGC